MSTPACEIAVRHAPFAFAPLVESSHKRVGIAGCGIITPTIDRAEGLLDLLPSAGAPPDSIHQRTLSFAQLNSASGLGPRATKKVDRFSLLGVAAARAALDNARLDAEAITQCGIVTGNMMAGWTFTEAQLRALHTQGIDSVSPYLATAWFPAAPQGQITINLKMNGFAKTVTTDRCAGAQAIGLAFNTIRSGRADLLLAGGVEAPVTPFVESACEQLGSSTRNVVEAAAYVLLSSEADAGTAIGFHSTFSLPPSPSFPVEEIATHVKTLASSLPQMWPVRTLICNVQASTSLEMEMSSLFGQVFPDRELKPVFSTRVAGECLAASGAVATVMAHEMLRKEASSSSAIILSVGHQCADLLWLYRTS